MPLACKTAIANTTVKLHGEYGVVCSTVCHNEVIEAKSLLIAVLLPMLLQVTVLLATTS